MSVSCVVSIALSIYSTKHTHTHETAAAATPLTATLTTMNVLNCCGDVSAGRAQTAGVDKDLIEEARDADDPKSALIVLIKSANDANPVMQRSTLSRCVSCLGIASDLRSFRVNIENV